MKVLEDFRRGAELVASQDELCDLFTNAIRQVGYHGFDAFSVNSDKIESVDTQKTLFVCDYGLDVFMPYFNDGWMYMDPSFIKIAASSTPFDYVALLKETQPNTSIKWQLGVLRLQRVHRAWAVPLNTNVATRAVTIYMRGKGKKMELLFAQTRDEIHLMADTFMETWMKVNRDVAINSENIVRHSFDASSISPRETDCLHWAARGKTNWEIGEVLKISENTVRFHLKNAFVKLGANSRSRAVSRALHEGVITI